MLLLRVGWKLVLKDTGAVGFKEDTNGL